MITIRSQQAFNSTVSNLRDLDYASAITTLNQQITGLQVAQASFVQLKSLTPCNSIQYF